LKNVLQDQIIVVHVDDDNNDDNDDLPGFSEESGPRLLVAAQDGGLYIYSFDPLTGGECRLDGEHR